MKHSRNQHSVATECRVSGRGYWTAKQVNVVIRPADADTGIVLVRSDLPGRPNCQAHVCNRSDASLRTNLCEGRAEFQMVEHLMAALYAMEIDNCIVEIDSDELPGLDGSSQAYIEAIATAGLVIQPATREQLVIDQLITLREGNSWITASPVTSGTSHFGYKLSFDHPGEIADQSFSFQCTPNRFCRDVAAARTFVTRKQADQLHAQGVAKHVSCSDLLVFGTDGPIENELRYANECARHKTLDLVGDLALAGVELIGKFVSSRGGHRLNGRMAQALYDLASQCRLRDCHQGQSPRRAA